MSLRKYFLYFVQEHVDFRYPEIKSIIKLFNLDLILPASATFGNLPFWILHATEYDIKKIASRAISLRFAVEVWCNEKSPTSFHEKFRKFHVDPKYLKPSFKVRVETYNKHFTMKEKIAKIDAMEYLQLKGPIDLRNPENEFVYFEFWGMDPNNVPESPEQIIFGELIAEGQRDMVKTISLKTRKFIGNTSMDPLLSLLMANQALCNEGQFVFDPFCGSGSLMVAAAKFGSFVIGSDIDYMMLHGKSKPTRVKTKVRAEDECVKANMIQYDLQNLYVDVFVGDFSNCPFNDQVLFDAIITDPPYGIRESMEQVVAKPVDKEPRKLTVMTEDAIHYPSTSNYSVKCLYHDLLNYSSKNLKIGGRLVCWFPIIRSEFNDRMIPRHSALDLVSCSEQVLSMETSRILLTYEKVKATGDIIESADLCEFDFRSKYFEQGGEGTRDERRLMHYQENLREAMKRGKTIVNRVEIKKLKNKKLLLAREQGE